MGQCQIFCVFELLDGVVARFLSAITQNLWHSRKFDGFGETPYTVTLNQGTFIDRFGSDYGFYVCPAGIDYTMRSCAPGTEDRTYSGFVLKKSVDVQVGIIAPWFDEKGGGYQYFFPSSVMNLINDGSLRRVEQWKFASNDHAQPAVIIRAV